MSVTRIRFFAAARAAVGRDAFDVDARTLGDALDAVPVEDAERWAALRGRCSYLVDGVSTKDAATPLVGVELVDVMPPFAGG
ncbi:MoaD/ThiS family protein [Curtobacterium sp. MCBD17_003]|uniref:MoaD/ThiS family protein n=1 Tax=Curtobacterium sp. MCBD17_003 TaxID=2175667 RepID=UPI000DA90D83|nr:MoaD/ThiS family protein [Curtobacterium sp. MCBD17_003]WIE54029.1 MoaD/ThiS family protein [Curtobacterium sp. MCBD17_003]